MKDHIKKTTEVVTETNKAKRFQVWLERVLDVCTLHCVAKD